jgi:hypothetical protein
MKPIFRREETKPRRFFKPRTEPCYRCPMAGVYHCQLPSCRLPMCLKHRIRKAGGDLCEKHKDAQLVQEDAQAQTKFKDPGEAVPHEPAKTDCAPGD